MVIFASSLLELLKGFAQDLTPREGVRVFRLSLGLGRDMDPGHHGMDQFFTTALVRERPLVLVLREYVQH